MAEISAQMVKELREKTGAGMMDCKKALAETGADFEKAIDWLRQKGISKAGAKSARAATEGAVESFIDASGKIGALVEVNSETDFAARNDKFKALASGVAEHVAGQNPAVLKKEEGANALLDQKFQGQGAKTVQEIVTESVAVIGENIQVRRFVRFESKDGFVTSYIHMGGKIGVLVELSGAATDATRALARDLAMHAAAAGPKYLKREEVPAEDLEREQNVLKGELKEQGKPEAMWDKILVGKVEKFYKDNCFVDQIYVKDPEGKKSVSQVLKEAGGIELRRFARFVLGEGLEKKTSDFAAEVAAAAGTTK